MKGNGSWRNALARNVPTDIAEPSFCGVPIRPDFAELRRTARELAEALADAIDLPGWQRVRFIREFEEKRVLEIVDWLTELYGKRGDDDVKGRVKFYHHAKATALSPRRAAARTCFSYLAGQAGHFRALRQ